MKKIFTYSLGMSLLMSFAATTIMKAQTNMPAPTVKNPTSVRLFVSKYFNIGDNFNFNACVNAVVYAKFKITKYGKIDSLDISATGPIELRQALKKAVLTTDGLWKMTPEEKVHINEKTYLLPIVCHYQSGCFPGIIDSLPIKPDPTLLTKSKDADRMLRNSLYNMMKFEKSTHQTLKCIIITPVILGSMQ
jgi:hypothetical protein